MTKIIGANAFRMVFFSLYVALAGCTSIPKTYRIATLSIPPKLDPVNLVSTSAVLVYENLYYPLFSRDEFGVLQSQFLDMRRTQALSDKYSEFRFCSQRAAGI